MMVNWKDGVSCLNAMFVVFLLSVDGDKELMDSHIKMLSSDDIK